MNDTAMQSAIGAEYTYQIVSNRDRVVLPIAGRTEDNFAQLLTSVDQVLSINFTTSSGIGM